MASTTIRIDDRAKGVLRELARKEGRPMQTVLEEAIAAYQRQKFLAEANIAFAALRRDADAWAEEQKERELWDRTVADGLESE